MIYVLSFLIVPVILGGVSVFFFKKFTNQNVKILLSFSGAYLLGISVLHLLPEIYESKASHIGFFILLGFILQILLELFSEGIEHGHVHVHKHDHDHGGHIFPVTMMISLCIHSFLEGMPLAGFDDVQKHEVRQSLLMGIVLHNIPIAFSLMSMLMLSGVKKQVSIFYLVLFALMAPAGFLLANFAGESLTGNISEYFDKIMAVVVGIFLHISTTILFESSEDHRFNFVKFVSILFGMGLALAL